MVNYNHASILHGYGDIQPQTLDTCSLISGRACAHTTSDRTVQKCSCKIRGSYVPNLVKIGPTLRALR